jgi:hypothetical protein
MDLILISLSIKLLAQINQPVGLEVMTPKAQRIA